MWLQTEIDAVWHVTTVERFVYMRLANIQLMNWKCDWTGREISCTAWMAGRPTANMSSRRNVHVHTDNEALALIMNVLQIIDLHVSKTWNGDAYGPATDLVVFMLRRNCVSVGAECEDNVDERVLCLNRGICSCSTAYSFQSFTFTI